MMKKPLKILMITAIVICAVCVNIGAWCYIAKAKTTAKSENAAFKNAALPGIKYDQIKYYFTRDNGKPDQQLIKIVDESKNTLDVAIYDITKASIVDAIIRAKNNNVNVRVITDNILSQSEAQGRQLARMKEAGIPIKVDNHKGIMHLKVTIADGKTVTTGSFNYTETASKVNDEVLMVINDTKIAGDFEKEFNKMWDDNSGFKEY